MNIKLKSLAFPLLLNMLNNNRRDAKCVDKKLLKNLQSSLFPEITHKLFRVFLIEMFLTIIQRPKMPINRLLILEA